MKLPRVRQVVVLTADAPRAERALEDALGLDAPPFRDPLTAEFGVTNAMYPVGDAFVEISTPLGPESPAWRSLERQGDGGFMVLIQVADLARVRARAREMGIRETWSEQLDDIACAHLHPKDVGGVPLSVDMATPAESWRWGGPASRVASAGGIAEVVVRASDPESVAARWAELLEVPRNGTRLTLGDGVVSFVDGAGRAGLERVTLAVASSPGDDHVDVGGLHIDLVAAANKELVSS